MLPYGVIRFGEGSLHKCEVMLKVRGTALTALLTALTALLTFLTITTNFAGAASRTSATSVWDLKLLVYAALSY